MRKTLFQKNKKKKTKKAKKSAKNLMISRINVKFEIISFNDKTAKVTRTKGKKTHSKIVYTMLKIYCELCTVNVTFISISNNNVDG